MSRKFELVIFTASHQDYANPIIDHLDPTRKLISHRLFRQHCLKVDGYYVKDLSVIQNRKKEDMILIDNLIYSFAVNRENGVPIFSYMGDKGHGLPDQELRLIADRLQDIKGFTDTRHYIDKTFQLTSFYDHLSKHRY